MGFFLRFSREINNVDTLSQCALIFQRLCDAALEINRAFSVPIFVTVTLKFVLLVGYSFVYILTFTTKNKGLENIVTIIPFTFIYEIAILLNILWTADMPIKQVGGLNISTYL